MGGIVLEECEVDVLIFDEIRTDGAADAVLVLADVGLEGLLAKHKTILTWLVPGGAEKDSDEHFQVIIS